MKITVEANVHAPIEKVWLAYTTPSDIVHWNAASDDWHTTRASVDLRPGGVNLAQRAGDDSVMIAWGLVSHGGSPCRSR